MCSFPKMDRITYLRLSITDRCDLRCSYCRPHPEVFACAGPPLTAQEIAVLVRAFAENGVTKVRLTGGEPLARPDVMRIVESVARTPGVTTVALTTNGIRLQAMAPELARAGLRRVNISLDSLRPRTFRAITGRNALDDVLRGLDAALQCGFEKVKLNTVVMRGVNDTELPAIADFAGKLGIEARFIELMPLGRSAAEWRAKYVSAAEIRETLGGADPVESERQSSARLYALPQSRNVIGIISPMSEHFCDECNRIRVTSTGKLKPCLRLPVEEDIRPLLYEPGLVYRLGIVTQRLSCHKLSSVSPASAVQAETMASIGG